MILLISLFISFYSASNFAMESGEPHPRRAKLIVATDDRPVCLPRELAYNEGINEISIDRKLEDANLFRIIKDDLYSRIKKISNNDQLSHLPAELQKDIWRSVPFFYDRKFITKQAQFKTKKSPLALHCLTNNTQGNACVELLMPSKGIMLSTRHEESVEICNPKDNYEYVSGVFSANDRYLVTRLAHKGYLDSTTIELWNVENSKKVWTQKIDKSLDKPVAVDNNGRVFFADLDWQNDSKHLKYISADGARQEKLGYKLNGYNRGLHCSQQGDLLAIGYRDHDYKQTVVDLYDVEHEAIKQALEVTELNSVYIGLTYMNSCNRTIITTANQDTIKVWDERINVPIRTFNHNYVTNVTRTRSKN